MYRDLIKKTEEYWKEKNVTGKVVEDAPLSLASYAGLADYLFAYLEERYLVKISPNLREGCQTLQDVYEMTWDDIFRPAACMETYALLNAMSVGYRCRIPKAYVRHLEEWMETADYRWDLPKGEKKRIQNLLLHEMDFSGFHLLPMTEFFVQDAVESYLLDNVPETAQAAKQFPFDFKEFYEKWRKGPDDYDQWPYNDELPLRFRYPANLIREARKKGQLFWEVKIIKRYEKYMVLQHRKTEEYRHTERVFAVPHSTVTYYYGKEKIEFFDYIKDEQGNPVGIRCRIEGGDDVEEMKFQIEELYLHKPVTTCSASDTLINHYYDRSYELTD